VHVPRELPRIPIRVRARASDPLSNGFPRVGDATRGGDYVEYYARNTFRSASEAGSDGSLSSPIRFLRGQELDNSADDFNLSISLLILSTGAKKLSDPP